MWHTSCEVKGSLVVVIVLKAFSFTDFVVSYVLSLVVCNANSSLSLASFAISKAFSFANPSIYNVLSFTILIIDPTFSLKALVVSKTFYFISSIVEPTLSFASPTFFWAFSIVSPIFCYTNLRNLVAFCFNCSKSEPAPYIVIFLLNSIILSFIFSNFIIFVWLFILCSQGWGSMIFNLTNVFFGRLNCLKHLLSNNVLCFTYFVLCYSLWGQRFQIKGVRLKFKGLRFEIIVLGLKS